MDPRTKPNKAKKKITDDGQKIWGRKYIKQPQFEEYLFNDFEMIAL